MTSIIVFAAGFASGYFFDAYLWPWLKAKWQAFQARRNSP